MHFFQYDTLNTKNFKGKGYVFFYVYLVLGKKDYLANEKWQMFGKIANLIPGWKKRVEEGLKNKIIPGVLIEFYGMFQTNAKHDPVAQPAIAATKKKGERRILFQSVVQFVVFFWFPINLFLPDGICQIIGLIRPKII